VYSTRKHYSIDGPHRDKYVYDPHGTPPLQQQQQSEQHHQQKQQKQQQQQLSQSQPQ
jgi:hypothetical protein